MYHQLTISKFLRYFFWFETNLIKLNVMFYTQFNKNSRPYKAAGVSCPFSLEMIVFPFRCSCGVAFGTKYEMYQHKKAGHPPVQWSVLQFSLSHFCLSSLGVLLTIIDKFLTNKCRIKIGIYCVCQVRYFKNNFYKNIILLISSQETTDHSLQNFLKFH